jgi:hypothetical protein
MEWQGNMTVQCRRVAHAAPRRETEPDTKPEASKESATLLFRDRKGITYRIKPSERADAISSGLIEVDGAATVLYEDSRGNRYHVVAAPWARERARQEGWFEVGGQQAPPAQYAPVHDAHGTLFRDKAGNTYRVDPSSRAEALRMGWVEVGSQ